MKHLVFTREAVRSVDRRAIRDYHVPGIVLMENAARGLSLQAMRMLGWPDRPMRGRVLIVCGGGNNGGDGFAAARHLHNQGVGVTLLATQRLSQYAGDAATNLAVIQAMGLPLVEATDDVQPILASLVHEHALIVDAMLGTGLQDPVRSPMSDLIDVLNRQSTPILAVDIPSGLDCNTGEPLGCAVKAEATVTFVGIKKGFVNPASTAYTGQVIVTDIGAPRDLVTELGELLHA